MGRIGYLWQTVAIEKHIVPQGVSGVRLQEYACEAFDTIPSRKGVKKAIVRGSVLIDGKVGTTGDYVSGGMVLELLQQEQKAKVFELDLEIVFEDEHFAVIVKPAGIVVSGNRFKTIQNALRHNLKLSGESDALPLPRPVHRLDEATSGLLLVAKTHSAMVNLGKQFEEGRVRKRYRAIVARKPNENGSIDLAVDGKAAFTQYTVVDSVESKHYGYISLLDLFPKTGRKHQLRVHLASLGHAILGDSRYSRDGELLNGKGLFLCAVELQFNHPATAEAVAFAIESPQKFARMMRST